MAQNYSYIYGFSDEIKETVNETVLSCFYIGKQERGTSTFLRGYDHLKKSDKNYKRFSAAKCFVIAKIPEYYDLFKVERYFTELVKPELNILNNPAINGKLDDELLCNVWDSENLLERINFYVFDLAWIKERYIEFDIDYEIKNTKERDENYGDLEPIDFDELLEKGTTEILKLFKKTPDILVSKKIKERINILSEKVVCCHLWSNDGITKIVNPYKGKDFYIKKTRHIGDYKKHSYYMEYSTTRAKNELDKPIKKILDKTTGKYITEKKLNNLVVMENTLNDWFGYFSVKYKVYYEPNHENQELSINFLKSHREGNRLMDKTLTQYFYSTCKILTEKYGEYANKIKIKSFLRDYRTIMDYCDFPQNIELLYLIGILKNLVSVGLNRYYAPSYITYIQKAKLETIADAYKEIKNSDKADAKEVRENKITYNDLVKFQTHTDKKAKKFDDEGMEKQGKEFVFVSYIDVPWALGYLIICNEAEENKQEYPSWLLKDWNSLAIINRMSSSVTK